MRTLLPIIRRCLLSPRRVAVVDDRKAWRGIELYIGALHLARAIEQATDKPHVGIMLPTSGLFPMALMATWMLGRTAVPLNYLLKRDELDYIVSDAEIDAVVTVGPMVEFTEGLPDAVHQIRLDEMKFGGFPPLRRAQRRPDDHLAVLLYTSGTSGRPKGVMLSVGNLAENVQQAVDFMGIKKGEHVFLGVLPQFHSFGLTALTLLPMTVGCKVVYTARFNPKKLLSLLREHRPTVFVAIPSMYNALLSAKSAKADDFSSVTYLVSGGEPLPMAVFNGFRERFNATIGEGYGLTETSPVTNWCRPEQHRLHSVGRAVPRLEQKIIDPNTGETLGVDEEGEITMRGPNIMQGYFKLPDETAKVLGEDGFFRTGDMGRIDKDGFLFITGRIKEMLIIGGENVFPREIEEVLNAHPSVHDSAVIGIMDPSRGEVPLAFVELEEDAEFDETSLRSHCRDSLAQFKVPREIRQVRELPRNPTGKIMRRALSAETPAMTGAES